MTTPPPARPGDPLEAVDTPALIVDLDAMARNLERMAEFAATAGVALRPHAKTHKSPLIARRQIALGAVGVCCQKVSEAEIMVQQGVEDVLVSNEVVAEPKIRRLVALARRARVGVCVDDPRGVAALSAAAERAGVEIDVLVEIDVGTGRCGVAAGAPALDLAKAVDRAPGLRFRGLQAYHGAAQHLRTPEERANAIDAAVAAARLSRDLIAGAGLPCDVITGGGTGTYPLESGSGVYTEIQPGSYVFMDADYRRNLREDGRPVADFEQALFVLAGVVSTAGQGRAVVDAGLKAVAVDSGLPLVHGMPEAACRGLSDEHGVFAFPGDAPQLGARLLLVPGHCDPTVNLHDWYVGVAHGRVAELWPVSARGAVF